MCGCGRKRTTVVTTAQVGSDDEARRALEVIEQQTVSAAENMLRSAANAANNARS